MKIAAASSEGSRKARPRVPHPQKAKAARPRRKKIGSLGVLYAHALAIEHEAEARYRELANHMADVGNDVLLNLFRQLAQFEGEHAFRLAKKSVGVEIPLLAPGEYAWVDCGAHVPEARNAALRELAAEFAAEEESHVAWVKDALARLPQPYQPSEDRPGDPGIEQQQ